MQLWIKVALRIPEDGVMSPCMSNGLVDLIYSFASIWRCPPTD